MALLAFDPAMTSHAEMPAHIATLLSNSQKLKTAGELNAAILASQSQGCESKLPQMLRLLMWGEELCQNRPPGSASDGGSKGATTTGGGAAGGTITGFPRLDLEGSFAADETDERSRGFKME